MEWELRYPRRSGVPGASRFAGQCWRPSVRNLRSTESTAKEGCVAGVAEEARAAAGVEGVSAEGRDEALVLGAEVEVLDQLRGAAASVEFKRQGNKPPPEKTMTISSSTQPPRCLSTSISLMTPSLVLRLLGRDPTMAMLRKKTWPVRR